MILQGKQIYSAKNWAEKILEREARKEYIKDSLIIIGVIIAMLVFSGMAEKI